MAGTVTSTIPELIEQIRAARRRVRDGRPRLAAVLGPELVEMLTESHKARGEGRTDVTGISWTPLSARYLKWKRKRGFSLKIGIKTGDMLRSLEWGLAPRGLTAKYAARHSRFFEKKLPQGDRRRLMPTKRQFPREWTERLEGLTEEWAEAELSADMEQV